MKVVAFNGSARKDGNTQFCCVEYCRFWKKKELKRNYSRWPVSPSTDAQLAEFVEKSRISSVKL